MYNVGRGSHRVFSNLNMTAATVQLLDPTAAEYPPNSPKKTSLAENPPEKNAASRKSAE